MKVYDAGMTVMSDADGSDGGAVMVLFSPFPPLFRKGKKNNFPIKHSLTDNLADCVEHSSTTLGD